MEKKQEEILESVWTNFIEPLLIKHGNEFAQALIGKMSVHTDGNTTCPSGYYWDTTTKSCVKDVG